MTSGVSAFPPDVSTNLHYTDTNLHFDSGSFDHDMTRPGPEESDKQELHGKTYKGKETSTIVPSPSLLEMEMPPFRRATRFVTKLRPRPVVDGPAAISP